MTSGNDNANDSRPLVFSAEEWQRMVRVSRLSPRQADIVGFMLRGRKRLWIQRRLGITASTFRTQYDRARVKLRARSNVEVAMRMLEIFRRHCE